MTKLSKKFNPLLLLFTIISVLFLSGCTPEYLKNWGISSYNSGDYLISSAAFKSALAQLPDDASLHYWTAKSYTGAGDYDGAMEYIKKAIELSPNESSYYLQLGIIYYRNNQNSEALDAFNKANALKPGTDLNNMFTYLQFYDDAGYIANALDLINKYDPGTDNKSRKERLLAYFSYRANDYNATINHCGKSILEKTDNELAYYILALAMGGKKDYDKAIESMRKALSISSNDVGTSKLLPFYGTLAYLCAKNRKYEEALQSYVNAINSANQSTYDKIILQAMTFYNTGLLEPIIPILKPFTEKADTGKIGVYLSSSSYLTQYSGDKAYFVHSVIKGSSAEQEGLQIGDKIVAVDDKPTYEAKGLSVKWWEKDKLINELSGPEGSQVKVSIWRYPNISTSRSHVLLDKTLTRKKYIGNSQKPFYAELLGIQSLTYRAKGEFDNAYKDAETAYNIYPLAPSAQLAFGLAKITKGESAEGLEILNKISSENTEKYRLYKDGAYYYVIPFVSDDYMVKLGKALANAKLGNVAEAMNLMPDESSLSKIMKPIWKEYELLLEALNEKSSLFIENADNLYKNKDYQGAINELSKAYATTLKKEDKEVILNKITSIIAEMPYTPKMPDDARKYMLRGEALLGDNDFEGSLNEYMKAMKFAPYSSKVYYNIAVVYGQLKNYTKAIEYMEQYIKLAPNAADSQAAKDQITKWEVLLEKSKG